MLHDQSIYTEPDEFNPERFITVDGTVDPAAREGIMSIVFGFGRRYAVA